MPEASDADQAVDFHAVKAAEIEEIGAAGDGQLLGLAFSGGGIRSATFNLGILQALAQLKLLRCFDYLSTVSGGGYIGSWLAGWIRERDEASKENGGPSGILQVEQALSEALADSPDPESERVQPIQLLRRYSNYLTPQTGLLSADTWTMVAIWLRNTFLNLLILIAFLTGVLLIPRWLAGLTNVAQNSLPGALIAALLAAAAVAIAVYFIGENLKLLDRTVGRKDDKSAEVHMPKPGARDKKSLRFQQGGIQKNVVAPVFAASWLGSAAFARYTNPALDLRLPLWLACVAIAGLFAAFLVMVGLRGRYYRCFYQNTGLEFSDYSPSQKKRAAASILSFALIAGAAGGGILYSLAKFLQGYCDSMNAWHVMSWGTPIFMTILTIVLVIYIGLLGSNLPDDRREWWSRLGAWLTIYNIGWTGLFAVAIYGPLLMSWFADTTAGAITGGGLGIGWIASTAGGVLSGNSRRTGRNATTGADDSSPVLGMLTRIAPAVFIGGLVLAVSFAVHLAVLQFIACPNPNNSTLNAFFCKYSWCTSSTVFPGTHTLWQYHWLLLDQFLQSPLQSAGFALACAACFALATGLSRRIDINEFSLHHFYKNRLVRCYLGANRGDKRKPNPFTGFDPDDDVYLARFSRLHGGYSGPYPIINTALNLVHGENLAWQERKAESFILTPRYCGFDVSSGRAAHKELPTADTSKSNKSATVELAENGYRPTPGYAYPVATRKDPAKSGIHIGTAMAISGAAASPNMGAGTSPASSFLMTVFNVRLGWWLGNPRNNVSYRQSDPSWGLGYLLAELLGFTDDRSKHVYLSDGGHFENLAIYELVRRECRFIVACDSEEDHDFKFGGLGNAIRKCRSDFGAHIDINVDQIRRDVETQRSGAHCVVGDIRYRSGRTGYLVYIKSSLTGDEPADVLEYAGNVPTFPHESTADQWFNESQFESYRTLGYHIGLKTFRTVTERIPLCHAGPGARSRFFAALRQQWYPPSAAIRKSFTRQADRFAELMERLRTDPKLAFLDAQFYREWRELMTRPETETARVNLWLPEREEDLRRGFYFCASLIQLMETVYLDLDLEDNAAHPDNRGWVRLFDAWANSAMFRVTWAVVATTYGARFQAFFENRHPRLANEVAIEHVRGGPDAAELSDAERQAAAGNYEAGDSLILLKLEISQPGAETEPLRFGFGYAVVDAGRKLRCIFVREHLRRMGLARRAKARLIEEKIIEGEG